MKRAKSKSSLYPIRRKAIAAKNLPATQGMLRLVRNEFKSEMRGLRGEIKADIDRVLKTIQGVSNQVSGLKTELRAEMRAQGEELRAEMRAQGEELRAEMRAQGEELRAEMKAQDNQLRKDVGIQFHQIASQVGYLTGQVARVELLVEEQNSKNDFVLEHLTGLTQRQDRVEARLDGVERDVRQIARSKPKV